MLLGSPAGPNGTSVKTFVFFDEGSSVSLMDPTLIEELGLAGEAKPLTIKWTDGNGGLTPTAKPWT